MPATQTVALGATQQFAVAVSTGSIPAVTWAVNGIAGGNASVGTISPGGLYTAPARLPSPATIAITGATADSTLSASVSLISGVKSLTLTPATTTVILGGSTKIDAVVNFDAPAQPDTAVTWWLSGVGNVTGTTATSALYSSPLSGATPAKTVVMAISVADPSKSESITLEIPQVSLTVSPASAEVAKGTTLQLTAQVTDATDGNVHWLVNGVEGGDEVSGTIDATGLYRAPVEVPPTAAVRLTAVSDADSSQAESANLTVRDFIDTSDPWVIGFSPLGFLSWFPQCQFMRTRGWYCDLNNHASLEQVARITFSEAMDPTTLGPGSLPINAPMSRSYNPTTHTVTFTPLTGLEYGKQYDLTVQNTVRDLGGNISLGARGERGPQNRFSFIADTNWAQEYQIVYVPELPAGKDAGYIYCLGQAVSDKVLYNNGPIVQDPVAPQCPFQAGAITPVTVMFQGNQFGYMDMFINTTLAPTTSYLSTRVGDNVHVDEASTAETLVFLAPQIAREPKDAKWVTDIIHNDPAVKQFAAVIATTASSLAVPQEDSGFKTAYAAAVNSVLQTVTAVADTAAANGQTAVTRAAKSATRAESTTAQADAWQSAGVQLFNVDTGLPVLSDFEIRLQGDSLLLHSRTTPHGKLNWLTDLAAIDPASLPTSLQDLTGQEVFPRLSADCGLSGPLAPCEVQFPLTSDETIISLARTPQNWSTVLPQESFGVEVAVPYKSETAYVVRRYSGGMANVGQRTSLIPRVPNGPALDRLALQNNLSSIALGAVLRASPGIKCNLIPQAYDAADKAILANVDLLQVDQMSLQRAMADTMRGIANAAATTAGCFGSPVTLNFIVGTLADLVESTPFDFNAPLGVSGEQLRQLVLEAAPLETDILTIGDIPTAQVCYLGITPETLDLAAGGGQVQLSAVTNDCNGNPVTGAFVTWTSSDSQIAYVSTNGTVTGRAAGTATIMVRAGALTYRTIPVTVH